MLKVLYVKLNLIKICAVFTLMCFLISTLGSNIYAINTNNSNLEYDEIFNQSNNIIDSQCAKITDSLDVGSNTTVINIQDLHCHYTTQRNISKIIKEISEKYNLKSIFVEGGYGNIDLTWADKIKDNNIKLQVIEKLFKDGLLTGSEYYALTNNKKNLLKGIDNKNEHIQNVKRLNWIISNQDKYKQIINKVNQETTFLSNKYINNKNKRFTKKLEEYRNGKISSKDFYKLLYKYAENICNNPRNYNNITRIDINNYPEINNYLCIQQNSNKIDSKKVVVQLQVLISKLKQQIPYSVYKNILSHTNNFKDTQKSIDILSTICKKENLDIKSTYPELSMFFELNKTNSSFNPVKLVEEERLLVEQIRSALSYDIEEYEISYILDFKNYLEQYLTYSLVSEDWKYFKYGFSKFRKLYSKYSSVDRIVEIEKDFDELNKYYEINEYRNNIFVSNLLKDIELSNSKIYDNDRTFNEILDKSSNVIIAVTGGFHSKDLVTLLKEKNVNTLVVTPNIYDNIDYAKEKYISIIEHQTKQIESQALSHTIFSNISNKEQNQIIVNVISSILGIKDIEQFKETFGNDINLDNIESIKNSSNLSKQELQIKKIIEIAIDEITRLLPKDFNKNFGVPNIDDIMINLVTKLIENGITFSNGMIYEIENSKYNGKDLNGVPAEIYSRMMQSFQKALLKIEKSDFIKDIKDLYEDTGATDYTEIYLEDIEHNLKEFLDQIEKSIKENKIIVFRVFRKPIDIATLDREEQRKVYDNVSELLLKLYNDKLLYKSIKNSQNEQQLGDDVHFFLLEMLKNAFVHGNKGTDKPIFVYMNLNSKNEINRLSVYNKKFDEDDTYQMRFIRMRLALLAGQHKGSVFMNNNPYRTYLVDDNYKNKFYKADSVIKGNVDEQEVLALKQLKNKLNYLSVFSYLKNRNKLFKFLDKIAPVWEELFFRSIPVAISLLLISLPINQSIIIPCMVIFYVLAQIQFVRAHIISKWIDKNNMKLSISDTLKAMFLNILPSKNLKNDFIEFKNQEKNVEDIYDRMGLTLIINVLYFASIVIYQSFISLVIFTIIGIVVHKIINVFFDVNMAVTAERPFTKLNKDLDVFSVATSQEDIEKITELLDELKDIKILNIDTDYDMLGLKIFLNEEFNNIVTNFELEDIQNLHIQNYFESNISTTKNFAVKKYYMAISIARFINSTIDYNILKKYNYNITELLQIILPVYNRIISNQKNKNILTYNTKIISLSAAYRDDLPLGDSGLKKILELMDIPIQSHNHIFVNANFSPAEEAKSSFLNLISRLTSKDTDVLVSFDGHGLDSLLEVGYDCHISTEEIVKALMKAYNNGVNLNNITLNLSSCYSWYFARSVYTLLNKEFDKLERKGKVVNRVYPTIWASAGYETKYGFFTNYKENDETIIMSNEWNGLITFFRNKKDKRFLTIDDILKAKSFVGYSNPTLFLYDDYIENEVEQLQKEILSFINLNKKDEEKNKVITKGFNPFVLSMLSPFKYINGFFKKLDSTSPYWEEILFRTAPIVVSVFNPLVGLCLFVIFQLSFIPLHILFRWIASKNIGKSFEKISVLLKLNIKIVLNYIPSIILPVLQLIGFISLPTLTMALINIPITIVVTIISINKHKKNNNILLQDNNSTTNSIKQNSSFLEYLEESTTIDLTDIGQQKYLVKMLKENSITIEQAKEFINKINLKDDKQQEVFVSILKEQHTYFNDNSKLIVEALIDSIDIYDNQILNLIKNIFVNTNVHVDEMLLLVLNKLSLKEDFELDFIEYCLEIKSSQTMELDSEIINKVDFNNKRHLELLTKLTRINSDSMLKIIKKINFNNENDLVILFDLLSSNYMIISYRYMVNLLIKKMDFNNDNNVNLFNNLIFNKGIDLFSVSSDIINYLDLYKASNIKLLYTIIHNSKESCYKLFSLLLNKLDFIDNKNHLEIFNTMIDKLFINYNFKNVETIEHVYDSITKILPLNTDKNIKAFRIISSKLIDFISLRFQQLQNNNLYFENDKVLFRKNNISTIKVIKFLLDKLMLEEQFCFLSLNQQEQVKQLYSNMKLLEQIAKEEVTIETFSNKTNLKLLKLQNSVYFDSDRYSFTKLLKFLPKRILRNSKVNDSLPTYLMEKQDIDISRLEDAISKFEAYKKLLDENLYVLDQFNDLQSFSSDFDDVVEHINNMINYLSVINISNANMFESIFKKILKSINEGTTTISQQKKLIEIEDDIYKNISTINTLINRIHQKANMSFLEELMNICSYNGSLQNVFVSKGNNNIKAYNLSTTELSPEIKKLLISLLDDPGFFTSDDSQIFIKDNILLWVAKLGAHSARVVIDFNEDTRSIFSDFHEGGLGFGNTIRIRMLSKLLSDMGFSIDSNAKNYRRTNNIVGLVARIDKQTGLKSNYELNRLAKNIMVLYNNAASFNNLDNSASEVNKTLEVASMAIMDIYSRYFMVGNIKNNYISTNKNNRRFFNSILSYLGLPVVLRTEKSFKTFLKVGFLRIPFIKTFGQHTIDDYINLPIEKSFALNKICIDNNGTLVKNISYSPLDILIDDLNEITKNDNNNITKEIEMLTQGEIISQIKTNFEFETYAQVGGYILKTGFVKLVNGNCGTSKGEFLTVTALFDENGIIRYTKTELVGIPNEMNIPSGRKFLNSIGLRNLLINNGYNIDVTEKLSKEEILNYRNKLNIEITKTNVPVANGIVMSGNLSETTNVGVIGKNVYIDNYANPDNVSLATKNSIALFEGGSYASHAGIVLREYGICSMIVSDSKVVDNKMKIKFYQPKTNVEQIENIQVQRLQETNYTLQQDDIVIVDIQNNRLLLFPNEKFKNSKGNNILFELQNYIDSKYSAKITKFIKQYVGTEYEDKIREYIYYQSYDNYWLNEILMEEFIDVKYQTNSPHYKRNITKKKIKTTNYLPHLSKNNVYRLGEKQSTNSAIVGTKSAKQSELYLNIEQLKKDTGISNVAVPNGIVIDYTILEHLLGEKYTNLHKKLEDIIGMNNTESKVKEIELILLEIKKLISEIDDEKIVNYIGIENLEIFKNKFSIVRSSGVEEDGDKYSVAGIAESYGNIDYDNIPKAIKETLSSFFSERALDYMLKTGLVIKPAILIEEWIDSKKSGIMMSEDSNGNAIVQFINGSGKDIVSGKKTPYTFVVNMNSFQKIDGNYTSEKTLTNDTLNKLIKIMYWLEEHEGYPVDIEFLIDNDMIYIVQVRPITALINKEKNKIEERVKQNMIIDNEPDHIVNFEYEKYKVPNPHEQFSYSNIKTEFRRFFRDTSEDMRLKILTILQQDTNADGFAIIHLSGNISKDLFNIMKAISNNLLMIFFIDGEPFDSNSTEFFALEDPLKISKDREGSVIGPLLPIGNDPASILKNIRTYLDNFIPKEDAFFIAETLKNAFIHGNKGDEREPIFCHITLNDKNMMDKISVYNLKNEGYYSVHGLHGEHLAIKLMQQAYTRDCVIDDNFNNIFYKISSKLRRNRYIQKEDVKNYNATKHSLTGSKSDIVDTLYNYGFFKYLLETGESIERLTAEEVNKIEEKAKNYRYTFVGIFKGACYEIFSLFSKDFIDNHSNMTAGLKVVVWVIRSLSIGIGITVLVSSFSVMPITNIVVSLLISSLFAVSSTIISSFIIHLIWNISQVIINKKHNVLQTNSTKYTNIKAFKINGQIDISLMSMAFLMPIEIVGEIVKNKDNSLKYICSLEIISDYINSDEDKKLEIEFIYNFINNNLKVNYSVMYAIETSFENNFTPFFHNIIHKYINTEHKKIKQLNRLVSTLIKFKKQFKVNKSLQSEEENSKQQKYINAMEEEKIKQNTSLIRELQKTAKKKESIIKMFSRFYAYNSWKKYKEEHLDEIKQNEYGEEYIILYNEHVLTYKQWVHICDGHSILTNGNEIEGVDRYQNSDESLDCAITLDVLSNKTLAEQVVKNFDIEIFEYKEKTKIGISKYIKQVFNKVYVYIEDYATKNLITCYIIDKEKYNDDMEGNIFDIVNARNSINLRTNFKQFADKYVINVKINKDGNIIKDDKELYIRTYIEDFDLQNYGFVYHNKEQYLKVLSYYEQLVSDGKLTYEEAQNLINGNLLKNGQYRDVWIKNVIAEVDRNLFDKQQKQTNESAILPENVSLVNRMLQRGFSALEIAIQISKIEYKYSLSPYFELMHTTKSGKLGAKKITSFINRWKKLADKSVTIEDLLFGLSMIKHIVINYKYIKSSGIKEAIKMFSNKTYIDKEGQIHVPPVIIVEDIEEAFKDYELTNTGIKVGNNSIYQIKANGLLVYSTKNIDTQQLAKTLNTSNMLKSQIEKVLSRKTGKRVSVVINAITQNEGYGIEFEDDIVTIGIEEIKNTTNEYKNKFINSILEIKKAISFMYSQKTYISLETIDDIKELKQKIVNGKARKIITQKQYNELKEKLNFSKEEINILKQEGIEIYVSIEDLNSNEISYKNEGICGQIILTKENKQRKIYDYYLEDEIILDVVDSSIELSQLQMLIRNNENPIMIDINILENKFSENLDIINSYESLFTLVGKIKIKTGIGNITKKDIISVVYNMSFDLIPLLDNNIDKDYFVNISCSEMIKLLKIKDNDEISIILNKITDESIKEKFLETIKKRILAKRALVNSYKKYGLKDKKLEILLGEMLFKQNTNDIISNIFNVDGTNFLERIFEEKAKADNGDLRALNSAIEILLLYADEYKTKQIMKENDMKDINGYRYMLASA